LDVLAAPHGAEYQFRFDEDYVDADAKQRDLSGMEALVHFSIQQEAKYHDPAFIPVRRGKVIHAEPQAGIFVVTFQLGDYVALQRLRPKDLRSAVTAYTRTLQALEVPRPYDRWVSVGDDLRYGVTPFEETADANAAFRSTAELLQPTEWFRSARFVRVVSLHERDKAVALSGGSFHLGAGRTQELTLSHYEPGDVNTREGFVIDTDPDVIRVIGRPGFDVASRYDVVRVVLQTVAAQRHESRDTVVTVRPQEGVQGPTIRLPITVESNWRRTLTLGGLSTIALVLFGLPAVWTGLNSGVKAGLVIVGALFVSALQNVGWSVAIPSGFGYTAHTSSGSGQGDGSSPGGGQGAAADTAHSTVA
jgi:hypothetical protein